jgi:hypothetical protein
MFEHVDKPQQGEIMRYDEDIGWNNMGSEQICIGGGTSFTEGAERSVSVGRDAGAYYQRDFASAYGYLSGNNAQGAETAAYGAKTGMSKQSSKASAFGVWAGAYDQGSESLALGYKAGYKSQHCNTTVINATGRELNTSRSHALFAAPIRDVITGSRDPPSGALVVYYLPATCEIVTSSC